MSRTADEINSRIMACAKESLVADDPEHSVRNCAQRLVAEGWEERDIDEVINGALRVVRHLIDKSLPPE